MPWHSNTGPKHNTQNNRYFNSCGLYIFNIYVIATTIAPYPTAGPTDYTNVEKHRIYPNYNSKLGLQCFRHLYNYFCTIKIKLSQNQKDKKQKQKRH